MGKNKRKSSESRRVYSTETGRTCPGCLRGVADCVCQQKHATLRQSGDNTVRLHRETKGRKGKGVTLIKGLVLPETELAAIAKKLKARCGVGGAIKESVIELQTADREKVKQLLEELGHNVKIAGG